MVLLAFAMGTSGIVTAGGIPVSQMKRVVGIVEVPPIFGVVDPQGPPGARLSFTSHPVTVYMKPAPGSKVVTIVKSAKDLATTEYGYEESGALVYEERNGWYQIGIDSGSGLSRGWLRPADAGRYHSLADLLKQGPSYLTRSWDLHLAPTPQEQGSRYDDVKVRDVRVIEARTVKQETWLRIELLQPGACNNLAPMVIASGWIPAYADDGHLNTWFHSRGC